jgi:fucose permease
MRARSNAARRDAGPVECPSDLHHGLLTMLRGSRFFLLLLLCTAFVALGLTVASIGPALPELARQTRRSLAELGTLFIALYGGALLAQFAVGPIADRFGRRVVLVAGTTMFGAGALAMSMSPRLAMVIAFAIVMGLGYACVSLAVNVLASELTPHRRASTVNLVNVFFAGGAIVGPLLAAAAIERWNTPLPALQAGALLMIVCAPFAATIALPSPPQDEPIVGELHAVAHMRETLPASFVWSCAALLLLYVGSESSVGSWAPVYLRRSTGIDAAQAATITSVFWASLCAGRVLATIVGLHLSADRLLIVSFCGAIAGGLAFTAGHGTVWLSAIALAVLGVSYAPIYPTMMAVVTEAYPRSAGTAASWRGGLSSIGGMLFPYVHGVLIARIGTWTSAVLTLTTAIGMLIAWIAIRRRMATRARG